MPKEGMYLLFISNRQYTIKHFPSGINFKQRNKILQIKNLIFRNMASQLLAYHILVK